MDADRRAGPASGGPRPAADEIRVGQCQVLCLRRGDRCGCAVRDFADRLYRRRCLRAVLRKCRRRGAVPRAAGGGPARRPWAPAVDEGQSGGIRPAGLGARDTLRLEAGMRLYGNDMDRDTNPLEARLDWTLNLDKDFIGRNAIIQARERGLARVLVGFKMLDRSIPRHGYRVVSDGERVGTVSSGNVSFTLGYNIGMAYVPPALAEPGTQFGVDVRGTAAPAEVVQLPFYKRPHPK